MREVMAIRGKPIFLGRCGENMARCVVFDISEWQEIYGEGVVQLIHQRNGDKAPYPCVVEQTGDTVTWCVTSADVAAAGRGRAEMLYFVGDTLVKSAIYATDTDRTMGSASETAPEPYEGWVENVLGAALEAVASVEAAEEHAKALEESADVAIESAKIAAESAERAEAVAELLETGNGAWLPAVPDDDKEGVFISTARTLRLGSAGEKYNDDAQGELGLGEISVTSSHIGLAVRKNSTDSTRRYLRLHDSNAFPNIGGALRVIGEDGTSHAVYGAHNPVVALIWEKLTTDDSFAAQSLRFADLGAGVLTEEDVLAVEFIAGVDGGGGTVCFFRKGDSTAAYVPGPGYICRRNVDVNANRINFASGHYYRTYGGEPEKDNYCAIPVRVWKIATVNEIVATLAPSSTWYKSELVAKENINKVEIVRNYTPTGLEDEVWNADEGDTGAIKCYLRVSDYDCTLTMAPTTAGRIRMNADSSRLFEGFRNLETVTGLGQMDSSTVTTLYHAFLYCDKLKRIYAPTWQLYNCTNTAAFAPMCYQLEEINIGKGLPTVGQQFAYLCTNLRSVSGVSDATEVAAQAFHCCYRLSTIDLKPEKITNIGSCAFFLTPVEDTVDLSGVPTVQQWGTRAARWDAAQLAEFKAMAYPDDILINVPYPDSQNRYPKVQYTTGNTVQAGACNSLAMYHAWNAHYAGTDKVFTNWLDWWNTYFNTNGNYAASTTSPPSASVIATTLGWSVTTQYVNTANNFWSMLNSLKSGNPVYISREVSGSGANHASLVVGIKDGKLLILDSAGHDDPVESVTYALRIEDVFIQIGSANDDTYSVINFDKGA